MHISRLKLENWKNFKSVECSLGRRAFFVGPNASGKSNFLDALRFLRDICATTGGGLQSAIRDRGGLSAIRCLAAKRVPDIRFEVGLADDNGSAWTYILVIGGSGKPNDPRAFIKEETIRHTGAQRPILTRPDQKDTDDPERLTETALEQTSANKEFREIADFIRTIRYLHVVPQVVRDPTRAGDKDGDPFGGSFLKQINDTTPKTRNARLRRMGEALKVAVPQMEDLQLDVDSSGKPHLKAKYLHWRQKGAWQREDQFSDGTLRLLGLIWALLDSGGPLLLEEPELSLNPAVVSRLPRLMAKATQRNKRQTFVTTHSPDLLSDESIGLDEVFLLAPSGDGTRIIAGATMNDVRQMLAEGIPLPEAIMPKTRSEKVGELTQLSLF